jgi:hypothetical protein
VAPAGVHRRELHASRTAGTRGCVSKAECKLFVAGEVDKYISSLNEGRSFTASPEPLTIFIKDRRCTFCVLRSLDKDHFTGIAGRKGEHKEG